MSPTCEGCGLDMPDGGHPDLCPGCEDQARAAMVHDYPPGDPTGAGRVPPHGNTTR